MRHDRLYLADTMEAADHISSFLDGADFPVFESSELLRSAVVQKLVVIGEAAARVSEDLRSRHPQVPWPQIVAFPNILVHAYFGIDWHIVWRSARNRCPVLRNQIAEIFAAESAGEDEGGLPRPAMDSLRAFDRYIGIDYSGAETPRSSIKGLRVYMSGRSGCADEALPPPGPRKYWTRRGVAEWLETRLSETPATLVGIDHGFSFPKQYFDHHRLALDWKAFLEDFERYWPTHEDHTYVDFARQGSGAARGGDAHWRRLTEIRAGGAKSVFHFDVPGSVAKSTHAGLPWLLYLRRHLGNQVHFWPFDGWQIPAGRSAVAEVYPALWSRGFPREDRNADQHDAYSIARWMRDADGNGSLRTFLRPPLSPDNHVLAGIEGWILGVV